MRYTIAFGDPDELVKEVNDRMKDGWEPQGGAVVVNDHTFGFIAFQAMVKKEIRKEE